VSGGPIRLIDVELEGDLPALPVDPRISSTRILVRLRGRPLGIVPVEATSRDVAPEELAERIADGLGETIAAHLLDADAYAAERERFRRRAPFVTVVVATRNRPAHLAACLESLLELDYPRFEILVVDNAPKTESTADLVRIRFSDRGVRYIREDRPGLAAAHNRGLRESRAPFVAFTDDDVYVDPLWLLELAAAFEAAGSVGCVTGLILPAELENSTQQVLERYSRLGKGFSRRLFDLKENRPPSLLFPYAAGMFGSGGNMAFSREALERIGGFDSAIGTGTRARGGDDRVAFFGIVSAGYTLVYEPAAIVRHRHRADADLERQRFDYGAGVTAALTKIILDRPSRLLDIAWRIPAGLAHGLGSHSTRNAGWHTAVPRSLVRAERRGMLFGPVGYVASRRGRS
jgi:O-antigen biosynthesis protein